jgi:hypothetical protein
VVEALEVVGLALDFNQVNVAHLLLMGKDIIVLVKNSLN